MPFGNGRKYIQLQITDNHDEQNTLPVVAGLRHKGDGTTGTPENRHPCGKPGWQGENHPGGQEAELHDGCRDTDINFPSPSTSTRWNMVIHQQRTIKVGSIN